MKQETLLFRIEIETHAKSVMREVWLELYAKFETMSLLTLRLAAFLQRRDQQIMLKLCFDCIGSQ